MLSYVEVTRVAAFYPIGNPPLSWPEQRGRKGISVTVRGHKVAYDLGAGDTGTGSAECTQAE